jgi:transcriptional regulator with XRE-family HTH domain
MFGNHVIALRERLRLGQTALAHQLGVSQSYLCDVEKGRRNPTPHVCDKLAEADDMGIWPVRRYRWHVWGAVAKGWRVESPLKR